MRRIILPLYIFARYEPKPGKESQLRDELTVILEPTRAETGCVQVHLYESTGDPLVFFIHSEWTDDQAFNAHAQLPHMKRFLGLVGELIANPFQAARTKRTG
jgi:quinol monooxygenase YgiN